MTLRFRDLGIAQHCRIEAVMNPPNNGHGSNRPTYGGVIQSHLKAVVTAYYDLMDLTESPVCVFLEDDAVLTEEGLRHIQSCLAHLPSGWEVFQAHTIIPSLYEALLELYPEKMPPNRFVKGYFMSCACYIMHADSVRKFVQSRVNMHVLKSPLREIVPLFPFFRADGQHVIPETAVFADMVAWTTLYSCINTDENHSNDSSVFEKFKQQRDINWRNMVLLQRIYDNSRRFPFTCAQLVHLPSDVHWFTSKEEAAQFLRTHNM
ncbi:hypothetical protein EBU99_14995 [bacterium]|nr:hypothetical protein [bacterium]